MDFCPQMILKGYLICPLKYNCDVCDYHTSNLKDFKKHCERKKHGIKWILAGNIGTLFHSCLYCDYISCSDKDISTHLMSKKHPNLSPNLSPKLEMKKKQEIKTETNFPCDFCDKTYKYRSGYYRHVKRCTNKKNNGMGIYESQLKENETLINMLVKSAENNNKLCEKLLEVENQQQIIKNTINNNTFNNQKLNINVFLNQECKDAMNLTDFLNRIQLTLDDLDYTKDNGFVKGITNIFVRNLEEMSPCERPIHSIHDDISQQFYIKDKNEWQCDDREKTLDKSIDSVTKKQINKIKEWELQNPYWNNSEGGIDEYMKMVQTIMGGSTESERMHNKKIIKQELTDSVIITNNTLLST